MPMIQMDDETLKRLKELHRKRSLGVATGWEELDTVLAGLLGPLKRRKRCERCGDDGVVPAEFPFKGETKPCPDCVDKESYGPYCVVCHGKGRVGLGTELTMACPVCQEAE